MTKFVAYWAEVLLFIITAAALIVFIMRHQPPMASGAPVPLPKARPSAPPFSGERLAGEWDMTWGGGEWTLELWVSGVYHCHRDGKSHWNGWWRISDGMLWVQEAPIEEDGSVGCEYVWGVTWDRDDGGRQLPTGTVYHQDGTERTKVSLKRRVK